MGSLRFIPDILGIGESLQVEVPHRPVSGFLPEKRRAEVSTAGAGAAGDLGSRQGYKWSGPGETTQWVMIGQSAESAISSCLICARCQG